MPGLKPGIFNQVRVNQELRLLKPAINDTGLSFLFSTNTMENRNHPHLFFIFAL
jgi:hypothetical protein